ncbi:site-specific DNA-methyltransferase [Candidatus Palauibacter sp.]|uniref:site-specific DNA-methyltransferase n=1 Tax=Candidatus Palauibacter sp. TaxID=3101350 RepID=UPI003B5A6915
MRTPFHKRWAPKNAPTPPSPPPEEQGRFQQLLRELFQFDCADLDFGIYRIMNHKREVIDRYIDRELPGAIQEAVSQGALETEAKRADVFEETRQQVVESFGEDAIAPSGELVKYEETPLGKTYILSRERARHSESAGDVRRDIYNHLYAFFSRYYQDGDFVPKRRYSWEHPYVVPYNGEEVHFHWANRDQYYVKSAEHFKDYTYRTPSGISVRFFLRSAHVERDDVKGKKRFFFPLPDTAEWDGDRRLLDLPFEYRPLTSAEAKDLGGKGQQEAILERAEATVADALAAMPEAALALLDKTAVGEDDAAPTLFAHHAQRFARKVTSDYFIHRDLKAFLGRELDYYLKSEVLGLGALEAGGETRADAWLDKLRVIREVGGNIIDFLAQIEGFQKMLWEKRKFVVDAQYCVAVRLLPEELRSRVLECEAQWDEWRSLGCIVDDDTLFAEGEDPVARRDFLERNPGILLDTRHFDSTFVDNILAAVGDIDDMTDAVATKGENWQTLNLLQERYRSHLACIYTDPPYNTGDSEILYRNGYLHSSWLTLMADRLSISGTLLRDDAVAFVAIDDFEMRNLCAVVDTVMPDFAREMIIVNHHPQGGKAKTLAATHEYMVTCVRGGRVLRARHAASDVENRPFKRSGTAASNFRAGRPNSFYAILVDPDSRRVVGIEPPPSAEDASYPREPTEDGYVRVYPMGKDGSERVWRRAYESCRTLVRDGELTATARMTIYHTLKPEDRAAAVFSNWTDTRYNASTYGANLLTDLMGTPNMFPYPKSVHTVGDAIASVGADGDAHVLDYFAGSGTTGHAVINLNREDGGRRKFILVEMGKHFDTVVMPRLKKVAFSPEWTNGTAKREATAEESERGPRIIKYFRLESYEDALNNIEFEEGEESLFELEDYLLRYMLEWETKGSATLLNVAALERPFDYKLRLGGHGDGAEEIVDLAETFNYLLGLAVRTRRTYEDDGRRYLVYAGETRDGRSAVVIWRDTEGWTAEDRERDRDFVAKHEMTAGADEIWMNGDSMVEDARPLENLFKQRMFASTDG